MKHLARILPCLLLLALLAPLLISCGHPADTPSAAKVALQLYNYTVEIKEVENDPYTFTQLYAYKSGEYITIAYFAAEADAQDFYEGICDLYGDDPYSEGYQKDLKIGMHKTHVWVGTENAVKEAR